MYYEESAPRITEPEKSHACRLPPGDPGRMLVELQCESPDLRSSRANGVNSTPGGRRRGGSLLSAFCSCQALRGLGDAHIHREGNLLW